MLARHNTRAAAPMRDGDSGAVACPDRTSPFEEGSMGPAEIVSRAAGAAEDVEARGHRLVLELAGARTAYCSDERASGEWITRFFESCLVPSEGGAADATVVSTADPALVATLRGLPLPRPRAG